MKLQPNFSWQKYENSGDQEPDTGMNKETEKDQFQFQLQRQHIEVSNSVNATIDDESYFLRERMTSFVWINKAPIFKQTYALNAWTGTGTQNTINVGITKPFTVIDIEAIITSGSRNSYLPLPYVSVSSSSNNISIQVTNALSTPIITITTGGTDYSAYTGYVTLYYTKT